MFSSLRKYQVVHLKILVTKQNLSIYCLYNIEIKIRTDFEQNVPFHNKQWCLTQKYTFLLFI